MDNEKEFIKEQEEIIQEVAELNKEHKKYMEELKQERKEGLAEMEEHNKLIIEENNKDINELEQERKEGITEMEESLNQIKNKGENEMIENRELTVEEVEKANKNWETIETIMETMPYCGIKPTRIDTDRCVIYVEDIKTYFEASTENALYGIKQRLGIEILSDKELVIELRTENKRLRRRIEELQKQMSEVGTVC